MQCIVFSCGKPARCASEVRQRDLVWLHFLAEAELITLLTCLLIWHCHAEDSKQLSGPNAMLTIQINKIRQLLLAGHNLRCHNHLEISNSKSILEHKRINIMQSQKLTAGHLSAAAAGSEAHAQLQCLTTLDHRFKKVFLSLLACTGCCQELRRLVPTCFSMSHHTPSMVVKAFLRLSSCTGPSQELKHRGTA